MDLREPDVVTVAVSRVDGGVTVMRVVTAEYEPDGLGGRIQRWAIDPTPAYIDSVIAKHVEGGNWIGPQAPTTWRIVPNDFLDEQTDHYFRSAWKDDGGNKPGVDMPKARQIHREKLREKRAPLLENLDNDYMRADEAGNKIEKKRIVQKKQALRDATEDPRIDVATTPEELKAVIPDALRG